MESSISAEDIMDVVVEISLLQIVVFSTLIGIGGYAILGGVGLDEIRCLCGSAPCDCFDSQALALKTIGTVLIVAGAGLWIYQAFRKVKVVS